MSAEVRQLEPQALWNHFSDLNAVPRPSKKEERVIQFMMDFGAQLQLETVKDAIGNVIIKKPATPGMEDRATVILQSHLDMVHQKNGDTIFDFDQQGIEMVVDADWVKAKGTTLGADNGLGVASIMALLSSDQIPHPALEALFTIDEETGMTGAMELDGSLLDGTILLNLDTEDDDELSIGCAGGIDTNTEYTYSTAPSVSGMYTVQINLKGLMGGHSGMDIHKGRGNANKILTRVLLEMPVSFWLHSFDGGSLRNAIPREANTVISIRENDQEALEQYIQAQMTTLKSEFSLEQETLLLEVAPTKTPTHAASQEEKDRMLQTIYAVHNGVFKMSLNFDDLVEASSSLARVIISNGKFITQSLQRSSVESTKKDVALAVKAPFELLGAEIVQNGDYPGWEPNPSSSILKTMHQLYVDLFKEEPQVKACHAGLECGILGKHLPGVDMISFGPNIRHAHSPDECVQISSVQKFWKFLLAALANTPKAN